MINFGEKNHGKVFERKGDENILWSEVSRIVEKYKERFLNNTGPELKTDLLMMGTLPLLGKDYALACIASQ
jgi:hypothetical protein